MCGEESAFRIFPLQASLPTDPHLSSSLILLSQSPLMDAVGGGKSLEVPTGKLDRMAVKTKVPYTETSPELIFMQHPLIVPQPATVHLSKHLPIGGVHHVKCLQP